MGLLLEHIHQELEKLQKFTSEEDNQTLAVIDSLISAILCFQEDGADTSYAKECLCSAIADVVKIEQHQLHGKYRPPTVTMEEAEQRVLDKAFARKRRRTQAFKHLMERA